MISFRELLNFFLNGGKPNSFAAGMGAIINLLRRVQVHYRYNIKKKTSNGLVKKSIN